MSWNGTQLKHFKNLVDDLQNTFDGMLPIISAMQAAIEGLGGDLGDISTKLVPAGAITMWSGAIANIPSGWALCDGSNGTPNLTDRFVVGAGGAYSPGDTGGVQSVTLTTAQLPAHNHTASSASTGAHEHNAEFIGFTAATPPYNQFSNVLMGRGSVELRMATESSTSPFVYGVGGGQFVLNTPVIGIDSSGNHQHNITVNNTGSGQSHENRPPYYALAYIMKL